MSKKSDKLEEILTDVCFYYNPNLLKKEYRENMNLDRAKIKMVNKYYKNLVCLRFFYNKLFKYPNYFRNFYPETKEIKKNEALEHHIYAYLEDSDIFRNKLVNILNSIKNDLKNMKEEERINHIKEIVQRVENFFEGLKRSRHDHHHKGFRFLDVNLTDIEFNSILLKNFDELDINVEEVSKKIKESFERARKDWIYLSSENLKPTKELVEMVFGECNDDIRTILNIESLSK